MADATAGGLGERALVEQIIARLAGSSRAIVGPGDDAAVVAVPDARVVATTDVLVEGVHFRRDWSSGYDVGRKAAAQNLADVMAMGGVGTALLVGLVAPADLPVAWLHELADGLRDEAALVGAAVVGGDTVAGADVIVSVTALGDLQGRPPVTRAGARSGDVVVVSSGLGASSAGLARCLAGSFEGPLVAAHRRPAPPYALGPALASLGATAMCDVSDGLVSDLHNVCAASGVRAELDLSLLPVADGLGAEDLDHVLYGGEDHGLLATVRPEAVPAAEALGLVAIGRITAGAGVSGDGTELAPRGYEHFR
ncbi:MAG TPA: thiamine-phosphate kinase [Mycobacteriales bacterium]|nr:thiamine-phosphate kinase [Mycobacteriales bacterium]